LYKFLCVKINAELTLSLSCDECFVAIGRCFSSLVHLRTVRFTRASVPSILGSCGDNKVNTDLGVVSAGKGENKNEVEVAVLTTETDISAAYSLVEGTKNGVED
jgi:hypothetical protein